MARKSPSRLDMRKAAEAAEAKGASDEGKKKPKKAATTRARKVKEKPQVRKRLVWVVYSGSMKEEGRFPYHDRAAAEEKIELLKTKSKKMYFIQPVKEIIGADGVITQAPTASMELDDEPVKPKKRVAKKDDDDDEPEVDAGDDDDDDE